MSRFYFTVGDQWFWDQIAEWDLAFRHVIKVDLTKPMPYPEV